MHNRKGATAQIAKLAPGVRRCTPSRAVLHRGNTRARSGAFHRTIAPRIDLANVHDVRRARRARTQGRGVLKNIASNWLLSLVTIIVTYVLTPFAIHALGDAGYGTWLLISSITGYLLLLTLGVPMATVRYMAQYAAEGRYRDLNRAIASSAGLYLSLGGAAFVIGCILFAFFDSAYAVPPGLRAEARVAFFLSVLYVSAGFIGQLPYGIMAAHHDFVRRNVVQLAALMLRLGLTIALLTLRPSLVSLAVVLLAALIFEFSVMWAVVRRRYPPVRLRVSDFEMREVRLIFSFSLFVLVLNVGERLMFQSDALVIGRFLGVADIPYYAVANSLGLYLMEFVIAIAAVVMPTATKLQAQGLRHDLEEVFLKWSKVALSLTLMVGLFLLVLGPRFLGWWIAPAYESGAGPVLQILTVGAIVYLPVRGVALPILMGLGRPKRATLAYVVSGVVNVGMSIVLARSMGLVGVALGTAIPLIAYAAVLLVLACRELGVSVTRYTLYVVPRALVGVIPAAAVLIWFKVGADVHGIVGLATAGVVMVAVYATTWILFVYRNDPYVDLRRYVPVLRGWRRA
jgi:O-antigen/teichoic acid export membrane protein